MARVPMHFYVAVLLLLASLARADEEAEHELVEWIKSLGGYVNPRQIIRRVDPDDQSSLRGVFASEDIEEGELLLDLPMGAIIAADPERSRLVPEYCGLVSAMKHELELGDKSSFAPFLRLLKDPVSIPSIFTEEGKNMLRKVVGPHLKPQDINGNFSWWSKYCKGDPKNDALGLKALLLADTRHVEVDDSYLIAPFFVFYNHRDGLWENASMDLKLGEKFKIFSLRKIDAGEQIHLSYGSHEVPQVLEQWGFVEQLPHDWSFDIPTKDGTTHKIKFHIYDKDGLLQFAWLGDTKSYAKPTTDDVSFLTHENNRLSKIENEILCDSVSCPDGVPTHEIAVISQYYRVLRLAIDTVVSVAEGDLAGNHPNREDIADDVSNEVPPHQEIEIAVQGTNYGSLPVQ